MVLVEQWVWRTQEVPLLVEEKPLGGARWVRQQEMASETDLPGVKQIVLARFVVLWAGTEVWQM
eukprot:1202077-Ditylum_brightwellii.AAC.1